MDETKEQHIISEIGKSGHPLALRTSIVLNNAGWNVGSSIIHSDEKDSTPREIDITATKQSELAPQDYIANNNLLVECKKSNKGWVFFKQDLSRFDLLDLNILSNREIMPYVWAQNVFQDHFYKKYGYHTYHLVLDTAPDSKLSKVIYNAIQQVMSAMMNIANRDEKTIQKHGFKEIDIYYPVIVLDGELFSAKVNKDKIKVTEEKYIQVEVTNSMIEPVAVPWTRTTQKILREKRVIISVVKESFLPEFLRLFNKDTIHTI